jgi:hypothetical protein
MGIELIHKRGGCLVRILDQKVKVLRYKATWMVNVQWNYYGPEDATWKNEENMWEKYPHIFYSFEEDIMQDLFLSN